MMCAVAGWLDGWVFLMSIALTPIMVLGAMVAYFRRGGWTWIRIFLRGDQPAALPASLYMLATVIVAAPFMISMIASAEKWCLPGSGG